MYFSNSPCSIKSADESYFINEKFITDEEAIIAKLVFSESNIYEQHRKIYMTQYGTAKDKILLTINDSFLSEFNSNKERLLNRSITWGQYNKRRAELNEKMLSEMSAVQK